jgi:hypothetical protein
MSLSCIVHFYEIKKKPKSAYTLYIKGEVSFGGKINMSLEYTGADLIDQSNAEIPKNILRLLKEDLNDYFGYGPFDAKKLKGKIKNLLLFNYILDGDKAYRREEWEEINKK